MKKNHRGKHIGDGFGSQRQTEPCFRMFVPQQNNRAAIESHIIAKNFQLHCN